jgi:hypothetical protein
MVASRAIHAGTRGSSSKSIDSTCTIASGRMAAAMRSASWSFVQVDTMMPVQAPSSGRNASECMPRRRRCGLRSAIARFTSSMRGCRRPDQFTIDT